MNKRTQSIRSMFAGQGDTPLSADNKLPLPRVTSGAVKSLKETFTDVERNYQALRDQLLTGMMAIELDPALVDPSPYADRFEDQDPQSLETLKRSIAERGQEIPILVREHPATPGRFQSAYGHRRVRVMRELGRPVRAYVRALTDEDLILSQGIENSAREDLSFIERAIFAARLEAAGFQRTTVQSALSIDRAEASRLISVASAVPADIVAAIGRAPRAGRGRWLALAEILQDGEAVARARALIRSEDFRARPTDERFEQMIAAHRPGWSAAAAETGEGIRTPDGEEIARLHGTRKRLSLQIDRERHDGFARYLADRLPELYAAYRKENPDR